MKLYSNFFHYFDHIFKKDNFLQDEEFHLLMCEALLDVSFSKPLFMRGVILNENIRNSITEILCLFLIKAKNLRIESSQLAAFFDIISILLCFSQNNPGIKKLLNIIKSYYSNFDWKINVMSLFSKEKNVRIDTLKTLINESYDFLEDFISKTKNSILYEDFTKNLRNLEHPIENSTEVLENLLKIIKNKDFEPLIRLSAIEQLIEVFPFKNHEKNMIEVSLYTNIIEIFTTELWDLLSNLHVLTGVYVDLLGKIIAFVNILLCYGGKNSYELIKMKNFNNFGILKNMIKQNRYIESKETKFQITKFLYLMIFDHFSNVGEVFNLPQSKTHFYFTFDCFNNNFLEIIPHDLYFCADKEEIHHLWVDFYPINSYCADYLLGKGQEISNRIAGKYINLSDSPDFFIYSQKIINEVEDFTQEKKNQINNKIIKEFSMCFSQYFQEDNADKTFLLIEYLLKSDKNTGFSKILDDVWRNLSQKMVGFLLEVL